MTPRLYVDIETYSCTPIDAGVYRYVADPQFEILMAAWAQDNGPVHVAIGPEEINAIPGLRDLETVKVAHNAAFERVCFSRFLGGEIGQYLSPELWHDTQAVAGELGYPQGLAKLAVALGAEPKDEAGTHLINWFCKPDRNGNRRLPEDHPVKWAQFVEYCRQDVATLRDVDRRLGDFPTETERRVYWADQRINDRGAPIDVPLARAAVVAAEDNHMVQEIELMVLTGAQNPNAVGQLMAGLRRLGLDLPNLKKETVEAELERDDLTEEQRRALELRQEMALVATKKFGAALASVGRDGRLRGSFRFFGAHTGRWSGRGAQPQNLPREQFEHWDDERGKKVFDEEGQDVAILDLLLGNGADAHSLKALVRALFTGPLTVVDYASIEARVIAWLAGERWALAAFEAGRDIYVETAERMGGLTRSQGKVAVLALGYNGGINSLRIMGAEGDDDQLQFMVDTWREANPSIRQFWRDMGDAFQTGGRVGEHVAVEKDGTSRWLRLPSGRAIGYHDCRFEWVDTKFGRRLQPSFRDPKRGWQQRTYGGKLTENVTQAVARDLLAEALVRLEDAGLPVVGHVHDEVIVEGVHPVERVRELMIAPPRWAAGLPIDGEGFQCRRYRKA